MNSLNKNYTYGTHRLIPPAQTLANIQPHLLAMGITRCADVTGLDRLGIPVYCAIRPTRPWLQVSNGKGISHEAAKVSALMEAIEVFHAETPDERLRRDSLKSLQSSGKEVIAPHILPGYYDCAYFHPDFILDWVPGQNLMTNAEVWLPASAVYDCSSRYSPHLYAIGTNGLASGNHILEGTIHGLYEVIERDAIAHLVVQGRLNLQTRCKFIALQTIDDPGLQTLLERINAAEFKLVLIWVESCIAINTFWAILLDQNPYNPALIVNVGYGTHLSPSIAATRAITEAAQSRLTFIHGARDDLNAEQIFERTNTHRQLYNYFDRITSTTPWQKLTNLAQHDLSADYNYVLQSLGNNGYKNVYRVDLTRKPFHIPVVKVFVPGLIMNHSLF
ncbi:MULTISPECIES: YcaO-like family protein [unclassified Anabaena]|uniref:YcaO-like family protein n=1 Tax=unclassified Anabaena TaxID=2619674 RepID=UPI00082C8D5F|nr:MULTISPECIES: YcaO-like family protein [unclassified Anabaena]